MKSSLIINTDGFAETPVLAVPDETLTELIQKEIIMTNATTNTNTTNNEPELVSLTPEQKAILAAATEAAYVAPTSETTDMNGSTGFNPIVLSVVSGVVASSISAFDMVMEQDFDKVRALTAAGAGVIAAGGTYLINTKTAAGSTKTASSISAGVVGLAVGASGLFLGRYLNKTDSDHESDLTIDPELLED